MQKEEPGLGGPSGPLAALRKFVPFEASAASDWLGVGLEAARYRVAPSSELSLPALTHHWLVLVIRPPEELDLLYEGVKRHSPSHAGDVLLVPAGSPTRWRWSGPKDSLHVYLEPGLVERVAAEAFDLDPARLTLPPLDGFDLPHLRATMGAVGAELTSGGGAGGPLAAESLANVLAVHLIRHILAPRRSERGRDGALSPGRLRAVVEYIEEHLAGPTLEQMAAVTHLSAYHFARQFKAATGLPPYQYVILRRVERAKQLLQAGTDLSLAEVAADAGFSDQSQFSHHFKRLVGVTPRQFRMSARIA
jgi:AraC family transcriptional regulator